MRLLLIEDNPKMTRAMTRGLQAQGWAVDTCASGGEGEALASAGSYSCIILDHLLPDRDGTEVCRNLRRRDVRTPILVISSLSDPAQAAQVIESGADAYLSKPFEFAELLERVQALGERQAPTS